MADVCKNCNVPLEDGAEFCPECGAPTELAPAVDNSSAINELFGNPSETTVVGDAISAEQEAAFASGAALEFIAGSDEADSEAREPAAEKPAKKNKAAPAKGVRKRKPKIVRPKNQRLSALGVLSDKLGVHPVITRSVIMLCTVAVSFALGFFVNDFTSSSSGGSPLNTAGAEVLTSVLKSLPDGENFIPIEIYIKSGSEITEALIFGGLSRGAGDYHVLTLRVVKGPGGTTIYYPFDEAQYEKLRGSTSKTDNLTAAAMKDHAEKTRAALTDLAGGNSKWQLADTAYVRLSVEGTQAKEK